MKKNATSTGDKLLVALSDDKIREVVEMGASVTGLDIGTVYSELFVNNYRSATV